MGEYTLKLRRYQPESGEAPYWEEFKIDLDGKRSVLDGILQAKDRQDGSIGIRCSCRAAICGSCGVRINGRPGLACHMHLDEAAEQKLIDEILGRGKDGGRRISEIKDELGTMMNEKVAVFRDEAGLTEAMEIVQRLKEESRSAYVDDRGTVFNQDVLGAIELGYMLDCAETIVMGALERKESRGAQFRLDYPERNDDEWLKHITISVNGGDAPKVDYAPVTMTQWEPQERTY